MSAVEAVLVVPADGDPGGSLAAGACLAVPPRVIGCTCGDWGHPHLSRVTIDCKIATLAIPLWWGGALVPEGWDRFHRVLARDASSLVAHTPRHPRIGSVIRDAETAVCVRLASRVVRLTRDADGRLVEVSP